MAEKGGQPGNKNATKDKRLITDALRRTVTQNPDKLAKACLKLLDDAVDGNTTAFTIISDRLDGKPQQSIDMKIAELTHEDALDALENGSNSD